MPIPVDLDCNHSVARVVMSNVLVQGGPKSRPLPNYQEIVVNRITACQ